MAITDINLAVPIQPDTPGQEAATEACGPGASALDHDSARARFEALSDELKQLILDKYRHWNVEHDHWWGGVYDCFKSEMEEIGIEVDKMYFSGFWSQGDGACFEGRVSDWCKFLPSLGINNTPLTELADNHWSFSVEHSGHYLHENCTHFSEDLATPDNADDAWFAMTYSPYSSEIQTAAWMALICDNDFDGLLKQFVEAFKDHMRELYRQLEQEYDYLTSDEAVLDSLEANEQLEDAINEAIMEHDNA